MEKQKKRRQRNPARPYEKAGRKLRIKSRKKAPKGEGLPPKPSKPAKAPLPMVTPPTPLNPLNSTNTTIITNSDTTPAPLPSNATSTANIANEYACLANTPNFTTEPSPAPPDTTTTAPSTNTPAPSPGSNYPGPTTQPDAPNPEPPEPPSKTSTNTTPPAPTPPNPSAQSKLKSDMKLFNELKNKNVGWKDALFAG